MLDVDATDDPLHGHQEGRFFHGYYRHYCYLPLYIFCGEHLLCARLRASNIDGAAGTVEEFERIVSQIRARWAKVQIIGRGDSGFCRDALMAWCEANAVDYVFGLAKNPRLIQAIATQLEHAKMDHERTGEPARVFRDFTYRTRKSWSRTRRVVGKAEHLSKGANPRFIVTSLNTRDYPAQSLYEELYCARPVRRPHLHGHDAWPISSGCTSPRSRTAYCKPFADSGSKAPPWPKPSVGTIRLKLLKLGAQVKVTVRNVWVSFSQSYPYAALFRRGASATARATVGIRWKTRHQVV